MVEPFEMSSTSPRTSEIGIRVLSTTSNTRRIIRPEIIVNPENPPATVRITIGHQRKANKQSWDDIPTTPLTKLKAGEEYILELKSQETLQLFEELKKLYAIGAGGVRLGEATLVVGTEEQTIQTDSERASTIKKLLSEGYPEDVWKALAETDPDLTTRLSNSRIQTNRQVALEEFQRKLDADLTEADWQKFFERNRWIFGYGLNYQFLTPVVSQPDVGGRSINQDGSQIPDYLKQTEGFLKFSVLIEIKKPQTPLVVQGGQHRSGVWHLDRNLVGGVSQLQVNCRTWELEGARSEANQNLIEGRTFTVQPKGILVIGDLESLDNPSKRNTFEIFRRNLSNPEIITFDELYDRARFIVEQN